MTTAITFPELYEAYGAADPMLRRFDVGCWVMDRSWYDRMRALVPAEQERERAAVHARVLIEVDAKPPFTCPACRMGPFATMGEFGEHVANMADPDYREPHAMDYLLGLPVVVREGAGQPHIERIAEP
jgi:hypothetical protein